MTKSNTVENSTNASYKKKLPYSIDANGVKKYKLAEPIIENKMSNMTKAKQKKPKNRYQLLEYKAIPCSNILNTGKLDDDFKLVDVELVQDHVGYCNLAQTPSDSALKFANFLLKCGAFNGDYKKNGAREYKPLLNLNEKTVVHIKLNQISKSVDKPSVLDEKGVFLCTVYRHDKLVRLGEKTVLYSYSSKRFRGQLKDN